ncbi:hypothetical protein SH661x_001772 [Planctomicrobium sp. SH661]|uniref:hypothetical protein n=1 Tax=Planctomicrobium sp. SH661 TaxID=3448124 RepID=UPI003F5B64A8
MNPDKHPTDSELLAYLDETLSVQQSAHIEKLLREQPDLRAHTALLSRQRDHGGHTVGEIWRRGRLSCLSRSQLESYLLKNSPEELADYIEFHLQTIQCRYCLANIEDLQRSQQTGNSEQRLQKRYFDSSAGLLRSRGRK